MTALNAKLLRDLWRMKGQAGAIAAVIGVGVALLVMMTGLVTSLSETRDLYYDRYGLADIYAPVERAPERMIGKLADLPGVATAEGRITGRALLDMPGEALPVQAIAISLPEPGGSLNRVLLTAGRFPQASQTDEVLLLKGFADAHDLRPGATLRATMNGQRRSFKVTGLAQSPEFIYTTAPGELVPDDARFGVIWMGRDALAAAYDLEGAFNEALMSLARGGEEQQIVSRADLLLDSYGAAGAFGLDDLYSNRFVSEEILGLRTMSRIVPPIFLGVAAFLLNIVIGRIVQSEREEIGLMKAFGYSDAEVGWHYMKLVLAIALAGAFAGCVLGIAWGRALVGVYVTIYKFPFLVFIVDPASLAIGVGVSVLAASAGGAFVLERVFALAPAAAMRPPAPPDYSRSGRVGRGLAARLDQPTRMILRRLIRQPGRSAGSVIGIACGMAICAGMLTIYAGFDRTVSVVFEVANRSDMSVTFTHPVGERVVFNLASMEGVEHVEPVRYVSVILHNGRKSHRGTLTGLAPEPVLNRALDRDAETIVLPEFGLVLSNALAEELELGAGEDVIVDVREGRQPVLRLPVVQISNTLIGAPAYLRLDALNSALREPGRVSGAYLSVAPEQSHELYAALTDMPGVAGVSVSADARAAFERLMDTGAGAMRYVMGSIAFVIAFGIVYNTARIAYAERARDLAALRVIGFNRAETAFVLLGELAVVVLLAIPIGSALATGLAQLIAVGFSTDLYQVTAAFDARSHGTAALVVIAAAAISGRLVKRDLDRADLITVLKTRE